jgi:hypothetical protein
MQINFPPSNFPAVAPEYETTEETANIVTVSVHFLKLSVKPKDLRKRLIEYRVFKVNNISLPVSKRQLFSL